MINSQFNTLFGQFDIGSIFSDFSCQNRKLLATTRQESSMTTSHGDFSLDISGEYSFTGRMAPDAALPKDIKQLFNLLGKPDPDGSYPLRFYGSL